MAATVVAHEADETLHWPSEPDDIFGMTEHFGVEEVHLYSTPHLRLEGIVAIHSTVLGPALGGTRFVHYPSSKAALVDALRLARAMTYKAAIHGLPFGGGKAVLLAPQLLHDRSAYFEAWGKHVDTLGGRFITAEDSGTTMADMDSIAKRTTYVAGTSAFGDPAAHTAAGVRRTIEAALKFAYGRDALTGAHVAIQGVGHVGRQLAAALIERGARVTVADVDDGRAQRCARELGARTVAAERIYDVPADVFAPCALGGTVNRRSIERLVVPIVAGSANNQLEDDRCAELLRRKGVLWAPDYVANGGGLLMVAGLSTAELRKRIDNIYDLMLDLFSIARATRTSPLEVANERAEAVLLNAAS